MNKEEIDDILNGKSNEVIQACEEIKQIQTRGVSGVKLGIEDLDHFNIIGANNLMIFVGARPSMGKTHTASVIKDALLDKGLNPMDIAILDLNWEMQTKSTVLRDMKRSLNRNMRDILSREFNEEEKVVVGESIGRLMDKRVTRFNHVIEGDSFEYLVDNFVANNKGKECFIMVDHIHILLTKKQIDEFLFLCNKLKKKYTNLGFIIFFQLGRTIEQRWRGGADAKIKLNPKNFLPNSGDIYNTDSLYQFADLILTLVIPQVVDMDEYTTVSKDRNKHLEKHFIKGAGDNTTAKLKGRNRVYRNYIKIRLNDNFEDSRLYCDVLNPDIEDEIQQSYYSDVMPSKERPSFPQSGPPTIPMAPVVEFVTHNTPGIEDAKGKGFEDKQEKPF